MFSEGGMFFSANDMASLESDVMPSNGGSILSGGGLILYEVVILTEGAITFSEGDVIPSEFRRIFGVRYLFWSLYHPFDGRHDT